MRDRYVKLSKTHDSDVGNMRERTVQATMNSRRAEAWVKGPGKSSKRGAVVTK